MTGKSTSISVRITPRDSEFIAKLRIDDAITPSDKIRALLKEAREKRDAVNDLSTYFGLARKALGPVLDRLKEEEVSEQTYSELVSSLGDWLADILGYIASLEFQFAENKVNLKTIESELAHRIFRLCNTIIRMGVNQKAPCYDPEIIAKNLPPLIEIIDVIKPIVLGSAYPKKENVS